MGGRVAKKVMNEMKRPKDEERVFSVRQEKTFSLLQRK